jgi:pyrroloquinoline-quinone synthase
MNMTTFWSEFESRIGKYDLLKHAFYQAWTNGTLSKDDLRMYSTQYYKHIEAFPSYLEKLEKRLEQGKLRDAIEENRADELGSMSKDGRSHSDIWLDFAAGMGASRNDVESAETIAQIDRLVDHFSEVASNGETIEALAAFCAYESQVPRIAQEKAAGLKDRYGASAKTYSYFSIHAVADIEHTKVWKELIETETAGDTTKMSLALDSAEAAAKKLWEALDGIEMKRTGQVACSMAC